MSPLYGWIIGLASWMAPRALRAQWRRKREAALGRRWAGLGSPRGIQGELLRFAWESFSDAYWFQQEEEGEGGFQTLRRASGYVLGRPIVMLLCVLGLVFGPGLLREVWRTLDGLVLSPPPFSDARRVVLIYPANSFLESSGVLPIKYLAWREKCSSFEALAAYRLQDWMAPDSDGQPVKLEVLSGTANLLPTLGVQPTLGRGFTEADDRPGAPPVVLLTHDLWRERFRSNRGVLGRAIDLNGKLHSIVGVLPLNFWFVSRRTRLWTPLAEDLDPAKKLPPVLSLGPPGQAVRVVIPSHLLNQNPVQVAGRLKPGANLDLARYELRSTARRTYPSSGRDWVRLAPAAELLARPLLLTFLVIGFTAGLAALIAVLGVARVLWLRWRRQPARADLRYWTFFVAKSHLGLAALGCAWVLIVDPTGGLNVNRGLGVFATLAMNWMFALGACGFLHWSWRDQQLRCHVCLRRMRLPSSSGSLAGYLFDRLRTEYLCPAGHGTVSVASTEPGGGESSDWKDMDDSWRELFKKP
ncbi:MAG: ABC transporter permease [Acidobacteria bacterium]|nr:ABC transporter permease [Acidobacteriota bacterium]